MEIAAPNWPRWFAALWPTRTRRWSVINGYSAIPQDVLTDIALRGSVFAPIVEPNPHLAAIAEGKRQGALEIISLAGVNAGQLYRLSEKYEPKREG